MRREKKADKRERTLRILERLNAAYPESRCSLDHENAFQLVVATVLSVYKPRGLTLYGQRRLARRSLGEWCLGDQVGRQLVAEIGLLQDQWLGRWPR